MSAVSSIADVVAKALGIAQPLVDDAVAERYDKAFQNRIQTISRILGTPDSDNRADALAAANASLLNSVGYPSAPGVQGNLSIPVSDYLSFYTACAALEKDIALIAKFQQKLTSS